MVFLHSLGVIIYTDFCANVHSLGVIIYTDFCVNVHSLGVPTAATIYTIFGVGRTLKSLQCTCNLRMRIEYTEISNNEKDEFWNEI